MLSYSPGIANETPSSDHSWKREAGFSTYLEVPGAKQAGSEACESCHGDVAKNFQHAYHMQQGVQCEDCHGNGSLHIDGGGDVTKIISFSKRPAKQANGVCLGCHSRYGKIRLLAEWLPLRQPHPLHTSAAPGNSERPC